MIHPKKKYKVLQFSFLSVLLFGGFSLIFYEKGGFELYLNSFHHPIADEFFKRITHLGDGLVLAFFILLSALFCFRNSLLITFGTLIHSIAVHVCKQWLFSGFPRPIEYLKEVPFYQIPGVHMNHWQSFPSGHTTTAFMLATTLILILPKKLIGLQHFLFFLACLVGFSRIYLMQHFWIDVWAGALLGIATTWISYFLVCRYLLHKKFEKGILKKELFPLQFQTMFFLPSGENMTKD